MSKEAATRGGDGKSPEEIKKPRGDLPGAE